MSERQQSWHSWGVPLAILLAVAALIVSVSNRGASTVPTPAPSEQLRSRSAPVDEQSVTVYVTRTGSKYHRGSCRYLRQSKIPMSLQSAKRSYGACSVCRPPT